MASDRRASRLGILAAVAVLLFGVLGARLWFLQTVRSDELQAATDRSSTEIVFVLPERGRIFDSDGRILADNSRSLTVAVDWEAISDTDERADLWNRLSGWLDMSPDALEKRYDPKVYSPLAPLPLKDDVSEEVAIALEERVEDLPGIEIIKSWKRVYPYAPLASHVLGYTSAITPEQQEEFLDAGYQLNERVGQSGVELSMEHLLHGTPGRLVYQVDAAGKPLRLISETPAINGFDLQLSINLDVQQYAEQVLQNQLRVRQSATAENYEVKKPNGTKGPIDTSRPLGARVYYPSRAGSVTVMNYQTGQIAAMASYPTYDNRWFSVDVSGQKFAELFPNDVAPDQSVLVNRAIQGQYNMGSTFKVFTAYAALQSGMMSGNDYYNDTGTYKVQSISEETCALGVRCEFRNSICADGLPCVYGAVNITLALAVSSDAFFYHLGETMYLQGPILQQFVSSLGLGADTGIDLPYEYGGRVPSRESKQDLFDRGVLSGESPSFNVGDNIQFAIGQGLLAATPIQMVVGYSAIVNGGNVLTPHVVQTVYQPGVPDGPAGYANLEAGIVYQQIAPQARQIPMDDSVRQPIIDGIRRNITGPGANGRTTTAEELFGIGYPANDPSWIPIGGKTGTAQGYKSYPWNDSSAFVGVSLDPARPYTVMAYLERSGYGSQGAGPVVKCLYTYLSGHAPANPVVLSDPLDTSSTRAARSADSVDMGCTAALAVAERIID